MTFLDNVIDDRQTFLLGLSGRVMPWTLPADKEDEEKNPDRELELWQISRARHSR